MIGATMYLIEMWFIKKIMKEMEMCAVVIQHETVQIEMLRWWNPHLQFI